jgi:vesicle coat complex subunit
VQIAAVNALGDIGDPVAVPDLIGVGLRSPEPEIRAACAIALGRIPDPARCIPALVDASGDENAATRREAMDAISRHHGSNPELVFGTLVTGLSDFDAQVRESAALSLSRLRDVRAIEPLLQATGDRTAVVRQAAVTSLGELINTEREKEAYPIIELLSDNSPGVQSAALTSLTSITGAPHGNDQPRWREYFWKKYPDLNPSLMYEGKPKPRVSSGINSSGSRTTSTPRTQPRTQQGRTSQQGRTNQGRTNQGGRTNNTGRR